jgi:hypothetical protein
VLRLERSYFTAKVNETFPENGSRFGLAACITPTAAKTKEKPEARFERASDSTAIIRHAYLSK